MNKLFGNAEDNTLTQLERNGGDKPRTTKWQYVYHLQLRNIFQDSYNYSQLSKDCWRTRK